MARPGEVERHPRRRRWLEQPDAKTPRGASSRGDGPCSKPGVRPKRFANIDRTVFRWYVITRRPARVARARGDVRRRRRSTLAKCSCRIEPLTTGRLGGFAPGAGDEVGRGPPRDAARARLPGMCFDPRRGGRQPGGRTGCARGDAPGGGIERPSETQAVARRTKSVEMLQMGRAVAVPRSAPLRGDAGGPRVTRRSGRRSLSSARG